ncbi:MAG: hypothetical protein WAJ85_14640 [Candidatus Baltobacteraceae bacterium]|jgi:hypothetical protein
MLAPGFVVLAALTLSTPAPRPAATRHPPPAATPLRRSAEFPPPGQLDERSLYSPRARRRFASYLRLRLLEMREEGLERAADVVRRRLPVDTLLEP